MEEIFDIIIAINRLKERVDELSKRIDFVCRFPALIGNVKLIDEPTACKMLKINLRSLRELRYKNLIPFTKAGRTVLYDLKALDKFIHNKSTHTYSDS